MGFSFPLGCEISFLLGSNILLSMTVQQLVVVLLFSQEKMSVHSSTPPSCEGVIIIFCIILFIGFCGTDNFILYLAKYKDLCYIMNTNFYRKEKLLWYFAMLRQYWICPIWLQNWLEVSSLVSSISLSRSQSALWIFVRWVMS